MSFYVSLLPFIDGSDSERLLCEASVRGVAAVFESEPQRRVFVCPDQVREVAFRHVTVYVGPAGIGSDAPSRGIRDPRVGMWGNDRETKFDDVKDGLAQTALIVESTRDTGAWYQGGPTTLRALRTEEAPYLGAGCQFAGTHFTEKWLFFGGKPYGMNVALADGSSRFMKHTIDPAILEALFTIAGGESVGSDW
jgi:Protein of unknown function (DUF1559)